MIHGSAARPAAHRARRCVVLVVACGCLLGGCSAASTAARTPSSRTTAAATADRPDALPRLEASVESIGEGAKVLDQHNLSRVLRQLGGGLQPVSRATSLRLQDIAQRLDGSPPDLLTHPRLLKDGFRVLLDGLLAARVPTANQVRYRRALQAFDRASDAVQDLVPFSEQSDGIKAALRAATDAIFLARGQRPPFDEAAALSIPELPVGTFQAELEQAHASVSELASADWMASRTASSRALAALADVVEAADRDKLFRAQIHDVRFQAERLSLSETRALNHGQWVKVGLASVLDAWEALDWGRSSPEPVWGRSARAAVEAIDERSDLSFQRGAIQDAFRTTLAAFVAAAETHAACSESVRDTENRPAAPARMGSTSRPASAARR
jgi:hypothetical protein